MTPKPAIVKKTAADDCSRGGDGSSSVLDAEAHGEP
jgi:hypothetical protein